MSSFDVIIDSLCLLQGDVFDNGDTGVNAAFDMRDALQHRFRQFCRGDFPLTKKSMCFVNSQLVQFVRQYTRTFL